MPYERSTPNVPVIAPPDRSPVGMRTRGTRRALAEQIKLSVEKALVHPYHDGEIIHSPHGKAYFVVPAGDTIAESLMRGAGSEMLGNVGRISARMRHAGREGKVASDVRHAFGRFEVGVLNDDGYLPWMEHAMSIIQTSRTLKDIESLGDIGAAVNTAASVGIPLLKLITRDSARAKVTSLVANPLLAAATDVITATLGLEVLPVALWLSSSRLENGFDMGDQVADIGQFLGYRVLLDYPSVDDRRKGNVARAFLAEYTRGEGPNGPRPSPQSTEAISKGLTPLDHAIRAGQRLERYADLPGVGEAVKVGKVVRGIGKAVKREKRSMRERVNDILAVADQKIADATAQVAAHHKRVGLNHKYHEAELMLITWQYRKAVAKMLSDLATRAEQVIGELAAKDATKPRRGSRKARNPQTN